MDANCGIYEIKCVVNGRAYIGSSVNMPRRMRVHRWALEGNRHVNAKLQAAWNKYGRAAFVFSVLMRCDPSSRLFFEQRAINVFRAVDVGFNLARDVNSPQLGISHGTEARQKISQALRGRVVGEHTRAALRASGLAQREQVSQKMAEIVRNRPHEIYQRIAAANTGKTRSEESRRRIAQANKAKWERADYRAARLVDLERARAAGQNSESRAKMAAAQRARYADPAERERVGARSRGRKNSPETKEKMRQAALLREERKRLAAKVNS